MSLVLESLVELGVVERVGNGTGVSWVEDTQLLNNAAVRKNGDKTVISWAPDFLVLGNIRATRFADL